MNRKKSWSVLQMIMVGSSLSVGATDLYWQEDDSKTWEWSSSALSWKVDNTGESVSWGAKDEPRTAYFTSATKFAIVGPVPRSIVVDSPELVWLSLSTAHSYDSAFKSLASFVKKNEGTFEVRCGTGSLAGNGIAALSGAFWDIQAGTFLLNLEAPTTTNGDPRKFLGSALLRIAPDATFDMKVMAGVGLEEGPWPSVELDGGTFNVYSQNNKNRLNELAYNGGDISLLRQAWNGATTGTGDLTIMGKLTVTGSVARTLAVAVDSNFSSNGGSVCFNPLPPARTELYVEDVTDSAADDLTVLAGGATFSTTNGFVKTGAGTVRLANRWKSFTGAVSVNEGTLILDGSSSSTPDVTVTAGAFLGGTGTVRSVSLAAGAGLAVSTERTKPLMVQTAVTLPSSGIIDVVCAGALPNALRMNVIRSDTALTCDLSGWTVRLNGQATNKLKLEQSGATIVASVVTDLYWQEDDSTTWSWTADTQYWKIDNEGELVSWSAASSPRRANFTAAAKFAIAGPAPEAIVVDSDALVRMVQNNNWSWSNAFGGLTSLVKKGVGAFEVWDNNNFAGKGIGDRSDMVWDIQEGTFRLDLSTSISADGKNDPSRMLGGSFLRIAADAAFESKVKTGIGPEEGPWPTIELDGGSCTLYCQHGKNRLDGFVYNGGTVSLKKQAWLSEWGDGNLTIMGKLTVTGSVARTLAVEVDSALDTANVCFNPLPPARTELYVEDVTGDAADDLTVPAAGATFSTTNGFVKTGAGTAHFANGWTTFSGVVSVNGGTLILDGAANGSAPDVAVADGAFLGGTGTVKSVSFDTGSGFAVAVGQKNPLRVADATALPASCTVDVSVTGALPERVRIPVIRGENGLSGDVTGWTILLNGQPTEDLVLRKDGDTVWVKLANPLGLTLIFR